LDELIEDCAGVDGEGTMQGVRQVWITRRVADEVALPPPEVWYILGNSELIERHGGIASRDEVR
jgi:hypothetical protein